MQIKRDWSISFDEEQFRNLQSESFGRVLQKPGYRDAWYTTLAEARELVQPAAVWDAFPVREVRHEKLVLANGVKLGGGPVTEVIGGAADLVVAVCTVGAAISNRIREYQRSKELFKGVLLDDLGSWAVDQVRQQLCHLLETDALARGLHASTSLSPGESAWSVKDQAALFELVDAGQIGVSLSAYMVMSPTKSLSLIMGTGPDPMGVEGGSHCDFCSIRERCNYRDTQGAHAGAGV